MVLIRGSNEQQQQQQQQQQQEPAEGQEQVCSAEGKKEEQPQQQLEQPTESNADSNKAADVGECSLQEHSLESLMDYVASAVPAAEPFMIIQDISAFKKGCEVYPSYSQQPGSRQRQQQMAYGHGAGAVPAAAAAASAASADDGVAASKL
jgi:hypothetical protein